MEKKILIVEDDVLFSSILAEKFRAAGFDVRVTLDGEAAIINIESFLPDVILLDLLLPQKNGFEVLANVRQNPNTGKIPVIVVSNLGGGNDIERAKKLGINHYIVKSMFAPDEVVGKVVESISREDNRLENEK